VQEPEALRSAPGSLLWPLGASGQLRSARSCRSARLRSPFSLLFLTTPRHHTHRAACHSLQPASASHASRLHTSRTLASRATSASAAFLSLLCLQSRRRRPCLQQRTTVTPDATPLVVLALQVWPRAASWCCRSRKLARRLSSELQGKLKNLLSTRYTWKTGRASAPPLGRVSCPLPTAGSAPHPLPGHTT
jgi:hypothetical protein